MVFKKKNPNVSVVILGASKGEQILENVGALDVARKLNPEIMKKIEDILKNKPQGDWSLSPHPARQKPIKSTI